MAGYAITLFLSAFLLFQVQPLIGKYILPWFGGGPGVWTTCLLFFQVLLLGGYAYAHLTSRLLRPRLQAVLHCILLVVALTLLPITPADSWKPRGDGDPIAEILLLLTACLGLPYFLLSSSGPLLQQWFSRANPGVSPYRLYALSNAGSLLALLSYPFVVESRFTRLQQAELWAWGFGAFVLCCAACAWAQWRGSPAAAAARGIDATPLAVTVAAAPSPLARLLWLLLPACASVLLLATTNKLCQDVAVMPFLWVLPLGIYLASFIVCFDHPRWYLRELLAVALVATSAAAVWALFEGTGVSIRWQVAIFSGALAVCCMVCHGELYRLRPDPRRLTGFYLSIAAGGAVGGVFVAVVSPRIFVDYYEMHWAFLLCALLLTIAFASDRASTSPRRWSWLACALLIAAAIGVDALIAWLGGEQPERFGEHALLLRLVWWSVIGQVVLLWLARKGHRTFTRWRGVACGSMALGTVALASALWLQARDVEGEVVARSRGFYGTLKVLEYHPEVPLGHYFLLDHGHTTHGLQFVDRDLARLPTTYYGLDSGLAKAIAALPERPRRIGVVGLGTGTSAVFGRAGDQIRIYEIDPDVLSVARSHFTYLEDSRAEAVVVLGDARLSLEHEAPQRLDLLALDAFNSDAIPVHLLTEQAFELYLRHLEPDGVIAVHISNRYLNLRPVVRNVAERFGLGLAIVESDDDAEEKKEEDAVAASGEGDREGEPEAEGDVEKYWIYSSTWALLTRDRALLDRPEIRDSTHPASGDVIPLWTDDFASLFQVLK